MLADRRCRSAWSSGTLPSGGCRSGTPEPHRIDPHCCGRRRCVAGSTGRCSSSRRPTRPRQTSRRRRRRGQVHCRGRPHRGPQVCAVHRGGRCHIGPRPGPTRSHRRRPGPPRGRTRTRQGGSRVWCPHRCRGARRHRMGSHPTHRGTHRCRRPCPIGPASHRGRRPRSGGPRPRGSARQCSYCQTGSPCKTHAPNRGSLMRS